ncbi:hypothetical protein [Methanoculleus chikugoensis]|uniref:hypothetical protein n=1 Tax=Methanoculleus chikugoensis TaxID=118126 RepID=UPI001FB3258E|nr:hypothetical protein [Methanoculleus chikugoensis]
MPAAIPPHLPNPPVATKTRSCPPGKAADVGGDAVGRDVVLRRPVVVDRSRRVDRPGVGLEIAVMRPGVGHLPGAMRRAGDDDEVAVAGGL